MIEYIRLLVLLNIGLFLGSCTAPITKSAVEKNICKETPIKLYELDSTYSINRLMLSFTKFPPKYVEFDTEYIEDRDMNVFTSGNKCIKVSGREEFLLVETDTMIWQIPELRGKEIRISSVYSITLQNKKEYLVLEWRDGGKVGTSVNYSNFVFLDKPNNYNLFYSYNGNITCFTDFDNDGELDFVQMEWFDFFMYSAEYEDKDLDIYILTFLSLKQEKKRPDAVYVMFDDGKYLETDSLSLAKGNIKK